MPKIARELSALEIKRLSQAGLHAVGGVSGLHLQIGATLAKSWIMRIAVAGKRRDIGLGGYPSVPLAQARDKARELRTQVAQGIDPVHAKKSAKHLLQAQQASILSFRQCASQYISLKSKEWKNPKHHQQWRNTLATYVYPVIGELPVSEIILPHITRILEPIWLDKTETAVRLRGRIEAVLDWASVHGYRAGENPARWRGHLDKLLPAAQKIQDVKHHPAMPIQQVGEFYRALDQKDGTSARMLQFVILTAARTNQVLLATWNEINFSEAVWVVPADHMKARKEHRVPLAPNAVRLLKKLPKLKDSNLLFPNPSGKALSNAAMLTLMRKMGEKAVPHGFRSTFRDWCAERTNYPRDLAEMALAHTLESKVEAAYRRGDMLERRRSMMEDWSKFLTLPPADTSIIPIKDFVSVQRRG